MGDRTRELMQNIVQIIVTVYFRMIISVVYMCFLQCLQGHLQRDIRKSQAETKRCLHKCYLFKSRSVVMKSEIDESGKFK